MQTRARRVSGWASAMAAAVLALAIAAQMVLGLTEPQSSGIGGGAFILHLKAINLIHERMGAMLQAMQARQSQQ